MANKDNPFAASKAALQDPYGIQRQLQFTANMVLNPYGDPDTARRADFSQEPKVVERLYVFTNQLGDEFDALGFALWIQQNPKQIALMPAEKQYELLQCAALALLARADDMLDRDPGDSAAEMLQTAGEQLYQQTDCSFATYSQRLLLSPLLNIHPPRL